MTFPPYQRIASHILIFFIVFSSVSFAQLTMQQRARLQADAASISERARNERNEAEAIAIVRGLPVRQTLGDGTVIELQRFRNGKPEYYITDNAVAAASISSDKTYAGGALGLALSGAGITLAEWDGGAVRTTHQEFGNRVTQMDNTSSQADHATHVSGTMIAAGVKAAARGMSHSAQLQAHDWNNDLGEMTARAAEGIQVSNHSYSSITGWVNNYRGDGRWAWFGEPTDNSPEDRDFGIYDSRAREWDNLVYNAGYYLPVKSAGNDRGEGPSSQPVQHWEVQSGAWKLVTTIRDKDGGAEGYDCIGTYGNAKNILTVGAVEDIPGGYSTSSDVRMTSFSCWGPSDDGRIKPDIVANGVALYSSLKSSNSAYASYSGTSMSSPSVAGSIGLILEHQKNLHGGTRLRASTIKGLVLHTADEAGTAPGPDYQFGWGNMNTASAVKLMSLDAANSNSNVIREEDVKNGQPFEFQLYSPGRGPMKVTICWTDPPGPTQPGIVDPGNRVLVNDMDLRVLSPQSTVHQPWVLDKAHPSALATFGDNIYDNVEQVYIAAPDEGMYTVRITNKGTLQGGRQIVSIIASVSNAPSLISPPNGLSAVTLTPALQWSSARGAQSYELVVAETPDFKNPVIARSDVSKNWFDASGLKKLTQYYWHVRVKDAQGVSDWSDAWSFTTGGNPSLAGHALYFDGADDYLALPHQSGFDDIEQNDVVTIEAWVKVLGWYNGYFSIVDKHNAATGQGWSLQMNSSSGLEFVGASSIKTNFIPQLGQWYHIAVSYRRAEGKIRFYVDGARKAELNYNADITATAGGPLYLGFNPTGSVEYANGVIDELRIWKTARTDAEISANMYTAVNGNDPGVAAVMHFDEGRAMEALSEPGSVMAPMSNGPVWLVSEVPMVSPAPPVLQYPGQNTVNIPVQPELRWLPATSAMYYRVQVSDRADFTHLLLDERNVTGTTLLAPMLQPESEYYWRANATNPAGTSDWAVPHHFTTAVAPPDAPKLIAPKNNAKDQPVLVTLLWDAPARANRYHVQVSTDSLFEGAFLLDREDNLFPTADVRDLGNFQKYFWRVRAFNFGGASAWSEEWAFTTLPAEPDAPVLNTPADDESGIAVTAQFTWSGVESAATYNFQLSEDAQFSTPILDAKGVPLLRYTASNLKENTWHYWRVSASNSAGTGPWSAANRFRTVRSVPGKVVLRSPADGALRVTERPDFTWQADTLADSYTLQVASDAAFTKLVVESKNLQSSHLISPQSLPNGRLLYWRVSAQNEMGSGPLSDVWSFTTIDSLAAPLLIAPANASVVPAKDISFLWHAVADADGYELEVLGTGGGTGGTQADTSAVRSAEPGETYHWRVRGWRGPLAGPWSVEWTFTTELPLPGAVTLLEPEADWTIASPPQLFRWTAAGPQVNRYHFEFADDNQFQTNAVSDSALTDTLTMAEVPFTGVCEFWWRVRAGNATGWGPWSEARPADRCDIDTLTGIAGRGMLPESPQLHPNYPNPFGAGASEAATMISYSLPRAAVVRLEVRDLIGRRIAVADEGPRDAGTHRIRFDAAGMSPGQYLIVLRAGDVVRTRVMTVL
ncbi:MAG: S8 family serine peptidase [Bacteroidetes bacterium]|nr:S8 family serine peptidase [Bacteroidota bacterium]